MERFAPAFARRKFLCWLLLFLQICGDLTAVEASVFDEYFACTHACDENSGEIDARDIAFERLRVDLRTVIGAFEFDTDRFEEGEVGAIASHGQDEIVLNVLIAHWSAQQD